MNLAEFPLATLAARAPRGCKTLVFEDTIWDRGRSQSHQRRLTISASDKYGLPAATDDEVILGLVQLTKAAGFADRRVQFSRYQLIRLLGWRDEGRSYARVEKSLKRWLGVTLYYENAWWDKTQQRWVDAHFHLLDDLVLYRRNGQDGKGGGKRIPLSTFTWNEIVFCSFRAGFLKQLDLGLYRKLKLAAAKRMYRFLDKRFHFSNRLRFELSAFACEHIGLSRRYDAAQLKRRLTPAIEELEKVGYLVPMESAERFRRLRRGVWEIALFRAPKRNKQRSRKGTSDLETRLIERGVTASSAARLVREHSHDLIRGKIEIFDQLHSAHDQRVSRNPAGYLVDSIRKGYAPPPGMSGMPDRQTPKQGTGGRHRKTPAIHSRESESSTEGALDRKIHRYLSSLLPDDRKLLEEQAIAAAKGLAAEGLRRSEDDGKLDLAAHYRRVILNQHLAARLEATTVDD